MTETIADAERQARRALERVQEFLSDDRQGRFGRIMAERARDQATYILDAISRGDEMEAWRVRGLMFESLGHLGTFTPEAVRGRKFKTKRTKKATNRATQAHKDNAEGRRQKVIKLARVLLKDGRGRLKNGRISATALAEDCVKRGREHCPVGFDSALKIIRDAVKSKKLA